MVSSAQLVTQDPPSALSPARRERGATMVEYALLVALIAVAAIGTLRVLGTTTSDQFVKIVTELGGEVPSS